ncbi:class I SAM-dependent methyltransferase [Mycolicibacterium komossense]|uniref:Class I SAM-dependent methyltransferase n=1 Tax=Mycolicibacterium komossense TaxID=1779 RepID=A0ABT3C8T4_9MYCO|nr:class I SAM-dependent methyltransferase [Mycolicibacterium komossense]MCV7225646.1 class I SAM-dependent methyltransferase [Mycolicibacterium komossense]
MAVTDLFLRQATLARSLRLLSEFRFEQRDPARFYGALAEDTALMVADLWRGAHQGTPSGRTVLDVGGGPGYFADAFAAHGLSYIGVEPDPREMHAAPSSGGTAGTFVRASGLALPFADDSVDICLSSNVAEHVARPWQLGAEMLRVTRPGGLAVLSYTVWLGPFGGHEMGLTHYFGGARAAARYTRKHGHPPKNNYGSSLFEVSAADGLEWATATGTLIAAFPRYHPRWAWPMTRLPVLREFLVSNLVLVLQPT